MAVKTQVELATESFRREEAVPAVARPDVERANPSSVEQTPGTPNGRRQKGPSLGSPRRLLFGLIALTALAVSVVVGTRWWYDSAHFVSTDNAQVGGYLVQVRTLQSGRVASVGYDVGDHVAKDAVVTNLHTAQPTGTTNNGAQKLQFEQTEDAVFAVRSPIDGVVVARSANPGDTLPSGQPVLTLVDPRQLWVTANVDETLARRIRPGQPATITVDALNAEL